MSIHDVAFEAMARLMESGTKGAIGDASELVDTLNRATTLLHEDHGIPRQAIADFVQAWARAMDGDAHKGAADRSSP